MTEDERRQEGEEEAIEDLEAPAAAQDDVAGGRGLCGPRSCGKPSVVCVGTCQATMTKCEQLSGKVVIALH